MLRACRRCVKRRGIIARGSEVARRQPTTASFRSLWARSMPPKQQHASAAQPAPRSMPLAQRVTDARHDDAGQDSADDSGAVDSGEPAVVARAKEAECCDDEFICLDALRCIALAAIGFLVGFGIYLVASAFQRAPRVALGNTTQGSPRCFGHAGFRRVVHACYRRVVHACYR